MQVHGEQRAAAEVRDRAGELEGDGHAGTLGADHAVGAQDGPARPARGRTPR